MPEGLMGRGKKRCLIQRPPEHDGRQKTADVSAAGETV